MVSARTGTARLLPALLKVALLHAVVLRVLCACLFPVRARQQLLELREPVAAHPDHGALQVRRERCHGTATAATLGVLLAVANVLDRARVQELNLFLSRVVQGERPGATHRVGGGHRELV